ncbi:MAG TPA: N-acetyltransferase [Chitinophaga sp.]|uniref:N-acetyltransferase n=1 Tax=Chitinophaga sp. TaxID=1869181 RepID=UPI002DB5FFFF|nr:N-acetyltransferase [Chitinophaga sp.]HEU4551675.1 N-acetyltransferase [Chitinophaga sp.]
MEIKVIPVALADIEPLRSIFLHESNFQFIYNKCHLYDWADTYLCQVNGQKAGYAAIWGQSRREDRDAVFEFYMLPPFRALANLMFPELQTVSGATFIECQSNDTLLAAMLYEYGHSIQAEAILFEEHYTTHLHLPGVVFRRKLVTEPNIYNAGGYILELDGEEVADGGLMLNYNLPYADIYMNVKEGFRQKGLGSLMVQELKKEAYLMGRVPAARCNIKNQASKATLQKAGLKPCGFILKGALH